MLTLAKEWEQLSCVQEEEQLYLKQIAGVEDLTTATNFQISITYSVNSSLMLISEMMPNLLELNINSSALSSLRDLGTGFLNLQILWISRCGLSGFEGLISLPNLKELYASYNDISDFQYLESCPDLEILDLEGNCVKDLESISYLGICSRLQSLNLANNPVSRQKVYRAFTIQAVSSLNTLDDVPVDQSENPNDTFLASLDGLTSVTADPLTTKRPEPHVSLRDSHNRTPDSASSQIPRSPSKLKVPTASDSWQQGGKGLTGDQEDRGSESTPPAQANIETQSLPTELDLILEGIKRARVGVDSQDFMQLEMTALIGSSSYSGTGGGGAADLLEHLLVPTRPSSGSAWIRTLRMKQERALVPSLEGLPGRLSLSDSVPDPGCKSAIGAKLSETGGGCGASTSATHRPHRLSGSSSVGTVSPPPLSRSPSYNSNTVLSPHGGSHGSETGVLPTRAFSSAAASSHLPLHNPQHPSGDSTAAVAMLRSSSSCGSNSYSKKGLSSPRDVASTSFSSSNGAGGHAGRSSSGGGGGSGGVPSLLSARSSRTGSGGMGGSLRANLTTTSATSVTGSRGNGGLSRNNSAGAAAAEGRRATRGESSGAVSSPSTSAVSSVSFSSSSAAGAAPPPPERVCTPGSGGGGSLSGLPANRPFSAFIAHVSARPGSSTAEVRAGLHIGGADGAGADLKSLYWSKNRVSDGQEKMASGAGAADADDGEEEVGSQLTIGIKGGFGANLARDLRRWKRNTQPPGSAPASSGADVDNGGGEGARKRTCDVSKSLQLARNTTKNAISSRLDMAGLLEELRRWKVETADKVLSNLDMADSSILMGDNEVSGFGSAGMGGDAGAQGRKPGTQGQPDILLIRDEFTGNMGRRG